MVMSAVVLSACAGVPPAVFDGPKKPARLVQGPPVEDIVTAYDRALLCMRGRVDPHVSFAVGQTIDGTGKESYQNGGTGKFVTQGSGEMAQSALFRTGVTVVNRRDPAVSISETNWGIRSIDSFVPATFYLSGSINSLDFIPGGGASVTVNGIGPRYRQNRILVGLDLALTDSYSGIVVANASLQKQIYASEIGFSADKFFGTTLVGVNIGAMEREALNFALRQMINLAVLELVGSVAGDEALEACRKELGELNTRVARVESSYRNPRRAETIVAAIHRAKEAPAKPSKEEEAKAAKAAPKEAAKPVPREALLLGRQATSLAGRSIAAMENSMSSKDAAQAQIYAREAMELVQLAVQALRAGAQKGLSGPEGDASALIVEQAVQAAQAAQQRAAQMVTQQQPRQGGAAETEPLPQGGPSAPAGNAEPPKPGTPEYERVMGR